MRAIDKVFTHWPFYWRLSNTLDGSFCLAALEESMQRARPVVFITDQGCQFTARPYTSRFEQAGVVSTVSIWWPIIGYV